MDFGKLFQSVEDAVYEVMVWILLLPKTLFFSMFKPKSAIKYVVEEWEKKPDERFDEYLSPVLLWLIVAVLPLSLVALLSDTNIQTFADFTKALSDGDKFLTRTLYAMIVPFIYIVWMEMINKRPVKKSTLKRSFYMHCYALAPAQFLFGVALFVDATYIFTALTIILLAVYEGFVFQAELGVNYKKALLYAATPQLAVIGLLVASVALVAIVLMTGG